ncbi:hypothetical protein [Bosea sp. MMO-172]|uniref:hypothetical protein n=1 Tax=Bosea sp. MMO-172 TaxID=3127885 RepID=UPI0030195E16
MASEVHPLVNGPVPSFIVAPGEIDTLLVVAGVILLACILAVGLIFLRLHSLPERMAHKTKKIQFEFVAVLGLLSLLTGVHIFWVAGLLLALIDIPDFPSIFGRMANALEKISGATPRPRVGDRPDETEPSDGLSEERSRTQPVAPGPGTH